MANCAGSEDNGSDSDPLIGKWKITSETTNGTPKMMTPCDLMQTSEFRHNGSNTVTSFARENGDCVPVQANVTRKWMYITSNNYQLKIYSGGNEVRTAYFQASFSDDKNTITTYTTNEFGEIDVCTYDRMLATK